MRRFVVCTIMGLIFSSVACKQEIRDDDPPTAKNPAATEPSESLPDPLATATSWIEADKRMGLSDETEKIAASLDEDAVVLRLFRQDDSYFALVAGDSPDRVVPAILLRIDKKDGAWSVTQTEAATSDLLWPEI